MAHHVVIDIGVAGVSEVATAAAAVEFALAEAAEGSQYDMLLEDVADLATAGVGAADSRVAVLSMHSFAVSAVILPEVVAVRIQVAAQHDHSVEDAAIPEAGAFDSIKAEVQYLLE